MANKYGTTYTKTLTPTPANKVDATTWGGRVRYMYDTYEASAVAQGDVVYLAKLPKGAKVLPQSQLVYDALGSSSALAVGYGTTPAALLASTATTSAGSSNLLSVSLDDDSDVFVTVSGSGAITGTVELHVLYSYK
jgi:hypothetical protein